MAALDFVSLLQIQLTIETLEGASNTLAISCNTAVSMRDFLHFIEGAVDGELTEVFYVDKDNERKLLNDKYAWLSAMDWYDNTLSTQCIPLRIVVKYKPQQLYSPVEREMIEVEDSLLLREPFQREWITKWTKGRRLGAGAFGVVHLGELPTGQLFAVKEIFISYAKAEFCEAATRELQHSRSLSHPSLITYLGCDYTADGILRLFLEYAPRGTLSKLVADRGGRLTEPDTASLLRQVVAGMGYLHDQGVLHRDIKSDNIFIDNKGNAKIGDFGCSWSVASLNAQPQGFHSVVGTPSYMSPECVKSPATVGPASDIWSIGCVACEMLCGQTPMPKTTELYQALYFLAELQTVPPNVPRPPRITSIAHDFLMKCLQPSPSERATCAELLLHPFLHIEKAH